MKFEPGRVDAIVKQFLRKLQIMREDQETYPRWIVPVLVVLLFLLPQLLMMLLIALVIYVAVQLASEKNGVHSAGKADAYRWERVQETRTEERTSVQVPLRQVREEEPEEEDGDSGKVWDMSLDRKEQLKQLEVLREAGIIEGKEYRERKRRIERSR